AARHDQSPESQAKTPRAAFHGGWQRRGNSLGGAYSQAPGERALREVDRRRLISAGSVRPSAATNVPDSSQLVPGTIPTVHPWRSHGSKYAVASATPQQVTLAGLRMNRLAD